MGLLDFFFPKRCVACRKFGDYLCPSCFATLSFDVPDICLVCKKKTMTGLTHPPCKSDNTIDGIFTGVAYKGAIKRLLSQFTYNPYLSDVQHVLGDLLYEGLIQQEQFYKLLSPSAILVPLPLQQQILRNRGYSQTTLLAKGLSKKLHIPMMPLVECVNTQPQVGTPVFRVYKKYLQKVDTVFLIDDLVTPNTLLHEAAGALKKAGVRHVYGVALAYKQ